MNLPQWFIALVALQRLIELVISRRNATRLLRQGAVEVGSRHYPLVLSLHVAWLIALWLAAPRESELSWPWLGIYFLLVGARVWVMATLGRYWTTRIIHVPNAPLIRHGPFRYCRHPNYVIVAGEIAVVPLAFGEWRIAIGFSILNAAMLGWRIRTENAALAMRP